jgi:hypothetical protein
MNVLETDWTMIAALESAIKRRYGDKAIQNPIRGWSEEKEQTFKQQLANRVQKDREYLKSQNREQTAIGEGVLIANKLLTRESNQPCDVCGRYVLDARDVLYYYKHNMCFRCYVKHKADR